MADLSKIVLPNNTAVNLKDAYKSGVYTVKGTQTAATGSWTGALHGVSALYDGLTIIYYLPYGGSGNATLNLTLDDGSTTGAINCYWGTSRLTTHYGAGSNIMLTYWSAGSISVAGTATTDNRWMVRNDYYANDQAYQIRDYYNRFVVGSNKVFPYTIILQCADGRWESIVTSSSTASTKTRNTHGFRLGHITLMMGGSTYNENATLGDATIYDAYTSGLVDHRYSFNTENNSSKGTTANKPVYLVGTINSSDGLFYLDETWWTQTLPANGSGTAGKIYIYLGDAIDYYRMSFPIRHPIYWYSNGKIREFAQDAATVNGLTVQTAVPANALFTDTNKYHKTGSWDGLTYTATAVNSADALAFTIPTGSTATTVSAGNHTHTTSLAADSGTSTVSLSANTKYKLTAGGNSVIFTTPTDNNTTYTFANGTNGFTVTPSGGTAQTVTVTPSITNNITGSGTSGYLTKFNGANTITNGPAFGSSTTTYLNNAGSWATPPDTKNTAGSTDTSSKIFLIGATEQSANPQTYSDDQCYVTSGTLTANNAIAVILGVNASSGTSGGVSLYNGTSGLAEYGIMFRTTANSGKHGYVSNDWATYFNMSNSANRGWVFRRNGVGGVASIDTDGKAVFNGSVTIGGNTTNTSGARLEYSSTEQAINFIFN